MDKDKENIVLAAIRDALPHFNVDAEEKNGVSTVLATRLVPGDDEESGEKSDAIFDQLVSTSLSTAKELELLRAGKAIPADTLYLNRTGRKFVIDLACGALKGYLTDLYKCKPAKPATVVEQKPDETKSPEQQAAERIESGKKA